VAGSYRSSAAHAGSDVAGREVTSRGLVQQQARSNSRSHRLQFSALDKKKEEINRRFGEAFGGKP
jgi:hypothetical protein